MAFLREVVVWVHVSSILLLISLVEPSVAQWRPCVELKTDLRVPCSCIISPKNPKALEMNCDGVMLTAESLDALDGQPIIGISRRNGGYRSVPANLVEVLPSLEKLDLSHNSISRLKDKILHELSRLKELRLAYNHLGDSLNPIFSTMEFHDLSNLRLLDLRGNGIKSIEEGMFKGSVNLEDLHLDHNNLTAVPAQSLKGPKAIRVLTLAANNIVSLPRGAFSTLGESLFRVDLSENELSSMDDGAFSSLKNLLYLNVSHNHLTRFNSDVFKGCQNLIQLDLSSNYLEEFPTDALRHLEDLKYLDVSDNMINAIERSQLSGLTGLQVLDLSRNNIGRLGINTFSDLVSLSKLDLSLNALRTIEESAFEGLTKLKWLSLQDNNILLIPTSALSRLPSLAYLHIEYNRVAALSTDLIRSSASNLVSLALTRNLVREIPPQLFASFERLSSIELSGNIISTVNRQTFAGLEDTLIHLDLSQNRLTAITELPLRNLISLNLAGNRLKRLTPQTFEHFARLQYLNISDNPLYGGFPPIFPSTLVSLDVSYTGLKILPTVLLLNLESLDSVSFAGNRLQEISDNTFQHLYNLTSINLSYNEIERIGKSAFVGLINLYKLDLKGNRLTTFIGEHFDTGTGLQVLDLSDNNIEHLSPTTFIVHPRLREINLSGNNFFHFPSDFIKSLQFLEVLDLSQNSLTTVPEFAFSQVGKLRKLDLSQNRIESVEELAFHNSSQLQVLDLSQNVLASLDERTMEGILRLEHLNLRDNLLTSFPETIFDPSRVQMVEKLDISGNKFVEIPAKALQKQTTFLHSLNLARNKMVEVFSQEIIDGIKDLDLSQNPLSANAVQGILGSAKVLRSLNLAETGIKSIDRLEMPFLKRLNLSGNAISDLGPNVLERTTMLEELDVSRNKLKETGAIFSTFKNLSTLKQLDISGNAIKSLNESCFEGLSALRSLRLENLTEVTRIDKNAFQPLKKLRELRACNYPRLGYFDVQGIVKDMKDLQVLDVEIKDGSIGSDQLSIRAHPRLRELNLRGERLRNVVSSLLAGVRALDFYVSLKNTSVSTLPAALFFPVPRSSKITLDVSGSKFATLSPQLIAALDERTGFVTLKGLTSNPINCDCEIKPFWRWLKTLSAESVRNENEIICKSPAYVADQFLIELKEDELSCNPRTTTQMTTPPPSPETTSPTTRTKTSAEPEIIWTVAPTNPKRKNKDDLYNSIDSANPVYGMNGNSSTDDTLIIGIAGGVVALIVMVIIIMCICRLRWGSQANDAHMAAIASSIREPSMIRPPSTYSGKMNQELYMGSPYNGTMTLQSHANSQVPGGNGVPMMMPFLQPMQMVHPSVQSPATPQPIYGYYDTPPLPVYVPCPSENKFDR